MAIPVILMIGYFVGGCVAGRLSCFDRISLPSIPIPDKTLSIGGAITLAAVLVGTLFMALAGGKAGQRFHTKIDRTTLSPTRRHWR